jgi:hypothetical protein
VTAPRQDDAVPWNREFLAPGSRMAQRGMPDGPIEPKSRIALWPGVRADMRKMWRGSVDFADVGFHVVTSWTKNRTMAGLMQPNPVLFDQTTDLDSHVLCNAGAARFLRLRYLLMPPDLECDGWTVASGALVDERWVLARSSAPDDLVRGIRLADVPDHWHSDPALSGDLALVGSLVAYSGTLLRMEPGHVSLRLTGEAGARGVALVLPLAYDEGWQTSAGRVHNIGGLLTVVGGAAPEVLLEFRPDLPLRIRAVGMTLAQVLGLFGYAALGLAGWRQPRP